MKLPADFAQGRNTARLTANDYQTVSKRFRVSTALTRAVVDVEAGGSGFWSSGNLKLLYEGHIAWRETAGDKVLQAKLVRAGVAWQRWGDKKYGNATTSRERLRMAVSIAGERAFRWASYGLPQTMGFNAELMKYASAKEMFDAYLDGERNQLDGMFRFIRGANLLDKLRAKDWHGFARGYNGSGYASHNYHGRLAAAYARHAKRKPADPLDDGVLRQGDRGDAVADLQADLNLLFGSALEVDGVFGRATFQSVHYAQGRLGLKRDGIAGPVTLKALADLKAKPMSAPVEPVEQKPLPDIPAEVVEDALRKDGSRTIENADLSLKSIWQRATAWLGGSAASVIAFIQGLDWRVIALIVVVAAAWYIWQEIKAHRAAKAVIAARVDDAMSGAHTGRIEAVYEVAEKAGA